MNKPAIRNISDEDGILHFTLNNINVSLANALRRIMLSEVPTLVFRTTPYNKNKCIIHSNTTRLNNELIKQRLSCIPIHISDTDFPYEDYMVEVNVKNDTNIPILKFSTFFKSTPQKILHYLKPKPELYFPRTLLQVIL